MNKRKGKDKVSADIINGYKPADKFFWIHQDDPDLEPVQIFLPKPPPLETIDGYGLPAKDQKFKPHPYPQRFKQLEDTVRKRLMADYNKNNKNIVTGQKILEETLKILNSKRVDYADEIEWIFQELEHIMNGYWCFINGKPTYMCGWHYFYTTYWKLDIGLPDYRDRDRRWFLFANYCYTTTEDDKGNDIGFRTVFGFTYPKHRRDGATFKCLSIGYCISLWKKNSLFGIQSFDKDNAGDHFTTKLVPAWQKLPFFLKPMWSGSNDPAQELNFTLPSNKVIGNQLGGKINFATTAHRSFYDGKKQMAHLSDENGKTVLEDVGQRHTVVKQTLAQGDGALIHGFSMHPTTVADMEAGGGKAFEHLCLQSKFYDRNELSGQTASGLLRVFIPAFDGLEGYIGPYGESIIDTPTPEQKKYIRRDYGSKQALESKRSDLLARGDSDSLRDLRENIQLYPTSWADCFRLTGGDVGFDVEKLDRRISEIKRLKISETLVDKGNFLWLMPDGGKYTAKQFIQNEYKKTHGGRVIWESNPDGNFEISKRFPVNQTNLMFTESFLNDAHEVETISFPDDIHGITSSADPFQFLDPNVSKQRPNGDTMSDGGGAAFWKRDMKLDHNLKPLSEWESHRFICTYLARPELDTYYAEEMLMMSIYYNSYMYPENNVKVILSHFISRGYKGYLMHKVDPVTKKIKDVPGFASLKESKDDLFKATRNHIALHIGRERHLKLINQWREIKHIKQMTDYDLLTAAGGSLLGSVNEFSAMMNRRIQTSQQTIPIDMIANMYNY